MSLLEDFLTESHFYDTATPLSSIISVQSHKPRRARVGLKPSVHLKCSSITGVQRSAEESPCVGPFSVPSLHGYTSLKNLLTIQLLLSFHFFFCYLIYLNSFISSSVSLLPFSIFLLTSVVSEIWESERARRAREKGRQENKTKQLTSRSTILEECDSC